MIQDEIKTNLLSKGYKNDNIIITTSNTRSEQIKSIANLINNDVDQLLVVPVDFTKKQLESGVKDDAVLPGDVDSIVSILNKARSEKIWTAVWGSKGVDGFDFDYNFTTPTVEDIANMQFGYMQSHFKLPQVDKDDTVAEAPTNFKPLNFEVLISDPQRSTTKQYFSSLLKRLMPYIKAGYLKSPSNLVNKKTTDNDYEKVSVIEDGNRAAGIFHVLLTKYYAKASPSLDNARHLDIVFCQSDANARGVIRAVVEFGWKATNKYFPFVLGAGAEKTSALDVVENKEAMSVAYDTKALALGVAEVFTVVALKSDMIIKDNLSTASEQLKDYLAGDSSYLYLENIKGADNKTHPVMVARPVDVTNDNLKEFLVDKKYILPQDAGI